MTVAFGRLREALAQLGAVASDLHKNAPIHSEMSRARDRVAERLELPEVPSLAEQVALHRRFHAWLTGAGEDPAMADWELSPFVYFHGDPQLGADPRFAGRVAGLIAAERRPRVLRRAIYAYLRDFSPTSGPVARLAATIGEALDRHAGGWAADWRARATGPRRLFAPSGLAERLATEICIGGIAPRTLFREIGLSTELITRCGLHRPMALELLICLNRVHIEQRKTAASALGQALNFLLDHNRLRFPEFRVATADQLLGPFADAGDPDDDSRSVLSNFFEQIYGDPRSRPNAWEGVGESAKRVMQRWLVRKSLDLFFDVLSATADPIWKYRRAFWLALYRHGLIDDAWPAFGRDARLLIQEDPAMRARLLGSGGLTGALSRQSVMVMKLRGFTVAEWSHAGACRVWNAEDDRRPALGRSQYSAGELRDDCLYSQIHSGTTHGAWQSELGTWIAQRTGVRVPMRELLANIDA